MATKRSKQKSAKQKPADKAHALWLTALGTVSIAQKRGGAIVSGLIAEGHDLQVRAQKLATETGTDALAKVHAAVAPFRTGLKRNVKKLNAAVQHGLGAALGKLGIPSKRDIDELTQRVAALSKQLKVKTAR